MNNVRLREILHGPGPDVKFFIIAEISTAKTALCQRCDAL